MFYVTKLLKLFDMTKPRLAKVRALFYVLQQLIKRGCAYFDTASWKLFLRGVEIEEGFFYVSGFFELAGAVLY